MIECNSVVNERLLSKINHGMPPIFGMVFHPVIETHGPMLTWGEVDSIRCRRFYPVEELLPDLQALFNMI